MRKILVVSEPMRKLMLDEINDTLNICGIKGIPRVIMHNLIMKATCYADCEVSFYRMINIMCDEMKVYGDDVIEELQKVTFIPAYHAAFDKAVVRLFARFGHDVLDYCGIL